MKITIGKTESGKAFSLPADAVTQKIALLARTGGGKTYAAKVLAEEFMHAKFPIVCIDPIGVWWGLRAEGESRGFEILIAGGDHQDIPLEPASGKIIADFFVRERVPMILDLSRFGENEMRRFVADFASELYHLNRDVMHLFVDEADEFAPQGGGKAMGPEIGRCLSAMQNVVRRGRARGIGCTLITQRSAVLSKSVLTQTEALFCFQTTGPQDLKAIDEWIQYHGTKDERNKIMGGLTKLQRGECWFYSPAWIKTLERIRIRTLKTFDSSRTPAPGESVRPPKSIADVNLPELTDRMKSCVEQAKANDPKELRAEITRLKSQLNAKPEASADPEAVQLAVEAAVKRERSAFITEQHRRDREHLKIIQTLQSRMSKAQPELDRVRAMLDSNGFDLPAPMELAGRPMPHAPATVPMRRTTAATSTPRSDSDIGKGEFAVLTAVAQHGAAGVDREQITVLTHYKKSTRDTYIKRLAGHGLIAIGTKITATPEGIAALGQNFAPLPTGDELRHHWIERLPEGESKVLAVAIESYPRGVSRDDISERTDYKKSTRDTYIKRLATRKLVKVGGGEVTASEHLFG